MHRLLRPGGWCMGSLRFFLLAFASVIFGDKGNGKCYAAASVEAAKGLCQESLVFAQAGDPSTCLAWAAQGFSNPCRAPLQGPLLPVAYLGRHVRRCANGMEVRYLQEDEVAQCVVLRSMWTELGGVPSSSWPHQSTEFLSPWISTALARRASTYKKSAAQKTTVSQEASCAPMESARTATSTPRSRRCTMVWAWLVACCQSIRGQGAGQGLSAVPNEHCFSAAASPAYAYGPPSSPWGAMDATTYAYDASSLHAAHGRAACCCSVIKCSGTIKYCGGFAGGNDCSTKAFKNHEGGQEGGQPFSRISTVGSYRVEARGEGKHRHPLGCCQRIGSCQRCAPRGRKCPPSIVVSVACISAAISHQVEGIHDPIPNFRSSLFLPRCKRLPIP